MALILEDGTGVTDADAYVPISDVDTYAANYGKTGWDALNSADKEIHIRRATKFIDNKYPFPGTPLKSTQGLFFPVQKLTIRGHAVTGIPRSLKDATCELAIISANGTDLVESVAARAYTYRKVKVGDVEKVERFDSVNNQNIFHSVELLLAPLLGVSVGEGVSFIKLRRA